MSGPKPPIEFAIRRGYRTEIIEITTVRGSHWWGRTRGEHWHATHGSTSDLLVRCATLAECQSRLAIVQDIEDQEERIRRSIRRAEGTHRQNYQRAIEQARTGTVPDPLPSPLVWWPGSHIVIDAPTLMALCQRWLDQDDATHHGQFERELQSLLERHP